MRRLFSRSLKPTGLSRNEAYRTETFAAKIHHASLTEEYYNFVEPLDEEIEKTTRVVNGNELQFFHGHAYSNRHTEEFIGFYQKHKAGIVLDIDNHLYDYVRHSTTNIR